MLRVAMFVPDELIAVRRPRSRSVAMSTKLPPRSRISPWGQLYARVRDVQKEWLELSVGKSGKNHPRFRVHMCDSNVEGSMIKSFSAGDQVEGKIIAITKSHGRDTATVSLRTEDVEATGKTLAERHVGYCGRRTNVQRQGGWVLQRQLLALLGSQHQGRAHCTSITTDPDVLNDIFGDGQPSQEAVEKYFPFGAHVKVAVVGVDAKARCSH